MFKAFTLLELIVVMAITAALMGLGIAALIDYRASVQLQSAYTDTVSAIKTFQNKAGNSSAVEIGSNRVTPDLYVLRFNGGDLTPFYCILSGGSGTLTHCDPYPSSGITSFQAAYNVSTTATCSGAGFARLTNDVVSVDNNTFNSSGNVNTTGTCILTLTEGDSGETRTITFDLTANQINL